MGNSIWFILYLSQVFFWNAPFHTLGIKHDQARSSTGDAFHRFGFLPILARNHCRAGFIQWDLRSCVSLWAHLRRFYGYVSRGTSVGETNGVSQLHDGYGPSWMFIAVNHGASKPSPNRCPPPCNIWYRY